MTLTEAVPTGMTVLELLRAGRYAEIRDLFAPKLRDLVTAEMFQAAWSGELAKNGPLVAAGAAITEPVGPGTTAVKIPLTFEHGDLALVVVVAENSALVGLQLAPASVAKPVEPWEPASYVDTSGFEERDVTFGSGDLAVPGTVSLPRVPGPWPGVVLVAGSGPNDRDETFGRNKPLKDVAWGLASQGVAVARFDKVTYAHRARVVANREFTLSDEYVPSAVAAVRHLAENPDVAKVFVLGHSQGGTVAPRVAQAEPAIAGLILMAGGAQPLQWATARQIRYLAGLTPETAAAAEPAIEAITRQAHLVDSPDLTPDTPAGDLPLGVPATYWLDLRGYDPAAAAAALHKPILVLQGARDYQVTVADDLALWQAALADRPDVTIRVYDADNHLFFPGTGPSTPAEYDPAQHVDPQVVADIAGWLKESVGDPISSGEHL